MVQKVPPHGTLGTNGWNFRYQRLVHLLPKAGTSNTNGWYLKFQPLVFPVISGRKLISTVCKDGMYQGMYRKA
ncbi:MAG: hypothetical protein EGP81_02230 [Bacteroides clarus]|uniref:hypothetical protein n=1 Tax=Bacteroides clarus TaxID=626929 RepID=UPI000B442457|nr:hypothetical protein [Bacteroides clarus]MBD9144366.1 hypothetical protein [Bacteroides clarus]